MKELKKALVACKYGLNYKQLVSCGVIMFVLGLAMLVVDIVSPSMDSGRGIITFSGVYMMIIADYIFQLLVTVSITGMVQASPKSKKWQSDIPCLFSGVMQVGIYTVIVIFQLVCVALVPGYQQEGMTEYYMVRLILLAVFSFVFSLYMAICYKFFIVSTIGFTVLLVGTLSMSDRLGNLSFLQGGSMLFYIVLGYVLVLAGIFVQYLVSNLLYRRPFDRLAFKTALNRAYK